jgi:hypothetical protein
MRSALATCSTDAVDDSQVATSVIGSEGKDRGGFSSLGNERCDKKSVGPGISRSFATAGERA